jgi:hypothetical protein
MPDDTIFALDPNSVRLLLRAKVGYGDTLQTDVPETPLTETFFLDLVTRSPLTIEDTTTEMIGMSRGQAEVLARELLEALGA